MSDAFDKYTNAIERMKLAEQGANANVQKLSRTIGPLLIQQTAAGTMPAWKGYYLTGLGNEVPTVLVRLGGPGPQRRPLDVGSIQADLTELQKFMVEYAEAQQAAFEAYQQIPPVERAQMIRPPWQPQ
jgi:hypothetical protein